MTMKEIYKQIGSRIREFRKKQDLTLEELSDQVGLDWSFLARIETGKAVPSVQSLAKISKALHVSLKDLFSTTSIQQNELLDRQATELLHQLNTSEKSQLIKILKIILSPTTHKK